MKEKLFDEVESFFKTFSIMYDCCFNVLRPSKLASPTCVCCVEICNNGISNIPLSGVIWFCRSHKLDFNLFVSSANVLTIAFYRF